MKVLFINSVCGIKSTGRIVTDLADDYVKKGYEVKIAYGRENVPEQYQKYAVRIGNELNVRLNALSCRLFDNDGFSAKKQTKKFLKWAEEYNPDILWIHNIHGYYINIQLLFNWIKSRPDMEVKWTLHDCWAFTGHCSHFDYIKCDKWKKECYDCKLKKEYPASILFDRSHKHYLQKKESIGAVKKLVLITPSQWLANLVKSSYMNDYPIIVVHNQIDLSVFKPTESDFRKKNNLVDKIIVLGVASIWSNRKGLDDFIKLSSMLSDKYKIVLVGLSKKQIKLVPPGILALERTDSAVELAQIYTAADVFLNLTYEDNYPTVNLEAQACGSPCITYRTGGSVESVSEEDIIEQGNLEAVRNYLEVQFGLE